MKNYSPLFRQVSKSQFNRRLVAYQSHSYTEFPGVLQYQVGHDRVFSAWIDYRNSDGKPVYWVRID